MAEVNNFKLPKHSVFIKFLKEAKGNIRDPKHIAYGGLLENSAITLPAKKLKNGNYANVLTSEEKNCLENLMGLQENSLSIYKKEDNYWATIWINLSKEGLTLDLSNPEDYIKSKVLESYEDRIASSLAVYKKKRKKTYQFIIVRPDEENKEFNKEVDVKKEVYKLLGKIEEDREEMLDYLMLNNLYPAKGTSLDWIKGEVNRRAESNPAKFIETLKDPNHKLKVLLIKAVKAKVVKVNGGHYQTDEGENISFPNTPPTLKGAIDYLRSPEGQEVRMTIEYGVEELIK